jgi:signal transduction histidine kinase
MIQNGDGAPGGARGPRGKAFAGGRWAAVVVPPALVAAAGGCEAFLILDRGDVSLLESVLVHAGALMVLVLAGVKIRSAERFAWSIVSSLRAFLQGERSVDALRVGEALGPVAGAYNAMLAERDVLAGQELGEAVAHRDATGDHNSGELQAAIDGMWQGLALFDSEGLATVLNGAIRVQLGFTPEQVIGSPVGALFSDGDIAEAISAVIQKRSRRRSTFEITRGENEAQTVLRVSVKPAGASGAMVVVEDVTQQRAASDAQAHMIAHTTHELRTPLSNIRLYVEEALDAPESDTTLRGKCLNVINQETRRLERMVEDLLSASEIESGSLKLHAGDVRLDAVFQELVEDYEASAADKNITLSFDLPPKLPVIQGDRQKLAVALHNLIGNALKYTAERGAVSVSVREDGGNLVVEIADTGIGIDASEIEHIFDRFYRSSSTAVRNITGTGLGLTLAREVARLHGGDITVESEEGQGSKFTMTVPLPEQLSAAA